MVEGINDSSFEFSPWHQRVAGWLSLLIAVFVILLGFCLLLIPEMVVKALLDYPEQQSHSYNAEVVKSVTRMAAGLFLAQGFSCLVLLSSIFQVSSTSDERAKNPPIFVYLSRLAIGMQSIFGLCWVVVGLIDDHLTEIGPDTYRRKTFGLLVVGFGVLLLSSFALMMSVWPLEPTTEDHKNNTREHHVTFNIPDTEPLLAAYGAQDDGGDQDQQEDDAAYRLLEDPPPGTPGVLNNPIEESTDLIASDDEGTSRVHGTMRLLKLAKPQVMYLYIGCITLLIRLPFSLSIPHFVSSTLGSLSHGDFNRAHREIFWLFVLGTIDAFLDFWCIFWFGYANQRIVRGVRVDTFAAILRQEIAFFDKRTSGELASRLNSDCGEMAGDLTWFFRFSIESVVRICGITCYMFVRSPRLAACAVSVAPIVATVNKVYGNWLSENSRKVQDALAAANSVAQETFSCVRTVIAFAAEQLEYEKYVDKINEQYRLNIKQTYMSGIYYMLVCTFVINTVVQGTLLLAGSNMIQHGNLTGEVLLAFMLYQGQLQNEMMNLFQSYSSLIKSSGAGDKVFGLLDRTPPAPATGSSSVESLGGPIARTKAALSVQLDNVSFLYPSRPEHYVLKGFNLNVRPGHTVALVGPSGCGKSTVVGLLQRLYDPTHGRILIDGNDLRGLDIKSHRQAIGVVTQDPTLFSGTILQNITYGTPNATREQAEEAAKMANAHDFIVTFPDGYETEVGERGVQLSGGQKQRLAISRAIIRNPSLLILDEATSALDSESEAIVQAALDNLLTQRRGITTVIIAHRLRTVRNADTIAVVNDGKIVELGPHDELIKKPTGYYRTMVDKSLGGNLVTE